MEKGLDRCGSSSLTDDAQDVWKMPTMMLRREASGVDVDAKAIAEVQTLLEGHKDKTSIAHVCKYLQAHGYTNVTIEFLKAHFDVCNDTVHIRKATPA